MSVFRTVEKALFQYADAMDREYQRNYFPDKQVEDLTVLDRTFGFGVNVLKYTVGLLPTACSGGEPSASVDGDGAINPDGDRIDGDNIPDGDEIDGEEDALSDGDIDGDKPDSDRIEDSDSDSEIPIDRFINANFPSNENGVCRPVNIKLSTNGNDEQILLGSCIQRDDPSKFQNRLFKCEFNNNTIEDLKCSFLASDPELPLQLEGSGDKILIPKSISGGKDYLFSVLCYDTDENIETPYCYTRTSSSVDGSEIETQSVEARIIHIGGEDEGDIIRPKIDMLKSFNDSNDNSSYVLFVADRLMASIESGGYNLFLGEVKPDGAWAGASGVGTMKYKPVSIGQVEGEVDDYLAMVGSNAQGSEICYLTNLADPTSSLECHDILSDEGAPVANLLSSEELIIGNVKGFDSERVLTLYKDGAGHYIKSIVIPTSFDNDGKSNFEELEDKFHDLSIDVCGTDSAESISCAGNTVYLTGLDGSGNYSLLSKTTNNDDVSKEMSFNASNISNMIAYKSGQAEGTFIVVDENDVPKLVWIPKSEHNSCESE